MPLFEHPLQLYHVTYPEGWEVRYEEETGGVIFVNSRVGQACALSFSPMGMTGSGPNLLDELRSAAARVGVELDETTLGQDDLAEALVARGEGDRPGAEVIGSRFRFWVVRHRALTLFITQLGPGAARPETRAAADQAVASLGFPEIMPPTIDEFRTRVLEILAREYPDLRSEVSSQWSIELHDRDGEPMGTVGLENLYRDCLLKSESAGAIIREYLEQLLQSLGEVDDFQVYDRIRDRLLPMLKSEDWIANLPMLATTEFVTGIRMCFAIDSPTRVAYVSQEMLAGWDVPLERVQEVAADNLARKGPLEMMVLRDEAEHVVALVVNSQDGYDATRLALPSVRDAFAEELGDEYLVGLPNRDFLIAFSQRDSETADGIIRQVKHDYQRMNHPITEAIFRVKPDRIEVTEF